MAWLIGLEPSRPAGLQSAAEAVFPFAVWGTVGSALWAIVLRFVDLERDRWPEIAGTVADFAGMAVLLAVGGAVLLPLAALLPVRCITTGIRYGQGAFYAALVVSVAIACVTFATLWRSHPDAALIGLVLLVGMPLTINRVHRRLLADSSAAITSRDAQGQFIGMISHELRSPLHVVINASQLIDRDHLPADEAQLLDSVQHSGQTLLHMVNDLLDHAAISAGKVDLKNVDFRMHHLVARINDVLEIAAQSRNIRLSWSVEDKIPGLRGSKRHIEQVVTNLATNAIKYTPPGGKVHVSVHHYFLERTKRERSDKVTLVFSIADTGVGISDADKKRIFEPFQQVSQGSARQYEGVGLGLHLVRTLSDKMGGVLDVQDNPGGGTIFTWQVDVAVSDVEPTAEPISALAILDEHRASVRPLRCLIIDDLQSNRDILTRILVRAGHSVEVRSDGGSGLNAIRTLPLDLVFMDLHMPGLSGFDVLEQLQQERAARAFPPIVVLSALPDADTADKVVKAGALAYITKPIAIDVLLQLLITQAIGVSGAGTAVQLSRDSSLALIAQISPEGLPAFVDTLLSDIAGSARQFETALIEQHNDGMRDAIHKLKSCCGTAGADMLTDACETLTEALGDGLDDAQIAARFDRIITQLRGSLQSFAAAKA